MAESFERAMKFIHDLGDIPAWRKEGMLRDKKIGQAQVVINLYSDKYNFLGMYLDKGLDLDDEHVCGRIRKLADRRGWTVEDDGKARKILKSEGKPAATFYSWGAYGSDPQTFQDIMENVCHLKCRTFSEYLKRYLSRLKSYLPRLK